MSRNVCLGQTQASAALVGSETDKACPQVCNGYLLDKGREHQGFETLLEEIVHSYANTAQSPAYNLQPKLVATMFRDG